MKYKIKKGRHLHSNLIARLLYFFFFGKELKRTVIFSAEAWYPENNKDDKDYNKLYGFGTFNPHRYSARFVWLPDFQSPGDFRVFAYTYDYGARGKKWEAQYLFTCSANQEILTSILTYKDGGVLGKEEGYEFRFKNCMAKRVKVTHPKTWKIHDPYHGGNNKAERTYVLTLNKT